ncbi:MAG: class I SAM-dependent methyltransferase [Actinobacteria bacterium]|nr:class I SAM-dependent methyltransferase [Actinomycetota bacterium]
MADDYGDESGPAMITGRHGDKRRDDDPLDQVQAGNRLWWESTPMSYDWRGETELVPLSLEWYEEQDRRSAEVHRHFATDRVPFDRLIPYEALRDKEVLEIGTGSGFHAELLARAGARVTGIDLTESATERTSKRFELKGLPGSFERWDAEQDRAEFEGRFAFVWSWGVVHHSARTARIVRNIARWTTEDGAFAGMVYHRDSTAALVALVRDWLIRGNLLEHSLDEALWRGTDGYTARFYPADQWRDLLLGFFSDASVRVTGHETDAVPLPRGLRRKVAPRVSAGLKARILARAGGFVTFRADRPLWAGPA